MPQTMLKEMLASLCRSGVEFCHSVYPESGQVRGIDSSVSCKTDISGFDKNIAGDQRFQQKPEGNHPYYSPERHPRHIEIFFPVRGIVDFQINGTWHLLKENKVHIVLPNTLHTERHSEGHPYMLFWVTSLPSSLTLHRTEYSPVSGYSQSACRIIITPPKAKALWKAGLQPEIDEPLYFSLLIQCLNDAVHTMQSGQQMVDYHNAVLSQIREYMDENFQNPITLDELAQMAHFSPVYLNSIFRKRYGISLHKYLSSLRIRESVRLLKAGVSPGETAQKVGFSDQRYFSRFFRKFKGVAPSQYQRTEKK